MLDRHAVQALREAGLSTREIAANLPLRRRSHTRESATSRRATHSPRTPGHGGSTAWTEPSGPTAIELIEPNLQASGPSVADREIGDQSPAAGMQRRACEDHQRVAPLRRHDEGGVGSAAVATAAGEPHRGQQERRQPLHERAGTCGSTNSTVRRALPLARSASLRE